MNDPAESNSVRRALYALFARLFAAPPDANLYGRLHSGGLSRLAQVQRLDLTSDLMDEEDAEGSAAELSAEYDRLFNRVSLNASQYRAGSEDPAVAVAAFLQEHALSVDAAACLPTDHLSVALGVMGALAAEAETAHRDGDPDAAKTAEVRSRAFFLRHVHSWVPELMTAIASRADRRFYRALAAMASAFLESERRLLEAA